MENARDFRSPFQKLPSSAARRVAIQKYRLVRTSPFSAPIAPGPENKIRRRCWTQRLCGAEQLKSESEKKVLTQRPLRDEAARRSATKLQLGDPLQSARGEKEKIRPLHNGSPPGWPSSQHHERYPAGRSSGRSCVRHGEETRTLLSSTRRMRTLAARMRSRRCSQLDVSVA
jgi:hypothetical protein